MSRSHGSSFSRLSRKVSNTYTRKFDAVAETDFVRALESLVANHLHFLALAKDYTEFLDDELYALQTRSNELAPVTTLMRRVALLSELYSLLVFSCQKKIQEVSVFQGLEQVVLDASSRSSVPSRPLEDTADFLRSSLLGVPDFLAVYGELFPAAAPMLAACCGDPSEERFLQQLLCDFVASYHCSDPKQSLRSPGALMDKLAAECEARGVAYDALALENVVFPLVLSICRERTERAADDARFLSQCETLKKATQSHFSIRLDLQCKDTSEEPWEEAVRELRSLKYYYTPTEMLNCIYRVAKAIFVKANRDDPIGGDDFMDILCFVVFKSHLRGLCSIANYIDTFLPDQADPEHVYYFTCMQLSLSFIRDLNWSKLTTAANNITKQKRNAFKKMPNLLIVEKQAFMKHFVDTTRPLFEVIASSVPLTGYCAYYIREYFDSLDESASNFFRSYRKSIVVRTGNPKDVLQVCAVRFISGSDNPARPTDFFGPVPEVQNLKVVDTRFGSLQCVEDERAGARMRFGSLHGIRCPTGSFGDFEADVSDFCVARQLLWPRMQSLFDLQLAAEWTDALCSEYRVDEGADWVSKQTVGRAIVREAQILLKLLACYPRLAPLDGRLTPQTALAVEKFQAEFCAAKCAAPDPERDGAELERRSIGRSLFLANVGQCSVLPGTGRINPATLACLYGSLLHLAIRLQVGLPADLVFDFGAVSAHIKSFQEKSRVYPSGSFDDATTAVLDAA